MLSVAKNPKAYMTYARQEHKERRLPSLAGKQVQDTFLSKTPQNRRLRQKHQRRRVLEKSENKNRLETYKQRETAAPVHVKERERGGGCFTTAILETKGAWRKEKYARPEAEVPRQQKEKIELRDLNSSFSNKR